MFDILNNKWKIFFIILIIFLLIFILYYFYLKPERENLEIQKKILELKGEEVTNDTDIIVDYYIRNRNRDIIEDIRLATILARNYDQLEITRNPRIEIYQQLINNVNHPDAPFIFEELKELDELDNLILGLIIDETTINNIEENIINNNQVDIKDKIRWHVDIQNVHDHILNKHSRETYKKIKVYNESDNFYNNEKLGLDFSDIEFQIEDENNVGPDEEKRRRILANFLHRLRQHKDFSKEEITDACLAISEIYDQNNMIINLEDDQKNIIINIIKRINSPINDETRESLESSIISNALLSISGKDSNGHPLLICPTGVTDNLLSSFALLDKDQSLGVFKTAEFERNEILQFAAKKRDEYEKIFDNLSNDEINNQVRILNIDIENEKNDQEKNNKKNKELIKEKFLKVNVIKKCEEELEKTNYLSDKKSLLKMIESGL